MVLVNAVATPLMLSSVNVALPSIARDLHLDAVTLTWVPLAYLMAAVVLVLPCGRLADRFGRRRVFMVGTLGVILSSLQAGAAWNGPSFLVGRLLQGGFTAMLYATQVAIVSSVVPARERGRYIGYTVASVYIGLTIGPALGGWLIESWSWRASLWVHLPLSLLSLLIGFFSVGNDWYGERHVPFDGVGSLLYGGGLAALLLGLARLPGVSGLLLALFGLLLLTGFLRHERRIAHPLIDIELLLQRSAFGRAAFTSLLMYTATFGNVVLVSLQLQYLEGASPLAAGQVMLIQPLTMTLLAPLFGRWSDRIDPRWLVSAGLVAAAAGLLTLAVTTGSGNHTALLTGLGCVGLGFSLFSAPNTNVLMGAVPRERYGAAAGVAATMRLLGQLASQGLVVMVFALLLGPVELARESHAALGQAISRCYLFAALALLPAFWLTVRRTSATASA